MASENERTAGNVMLRRVLVADTEARARAKLHYAGAAKYDLPPDPIQGLAALCERGGHKPWDWFWREDGYLTYRVMFRDLRPELWTWARPAYPSCDLSAVSLPEGRHRLTLRNLTSGVRFNVLYLTDEPSFWPQDGRMRQSL